MVNESKLRLRLKLGAGQGFADAKQSKLWALGTNLGKLQVNERLIQCS